MKILGFDPGSRTAGFGVLEYLHETPKPPATRIQYLGSGLIKLDTKTSFNDRLRHIQKDLDALIAHFEPHVFVLETAFVAKNVMSALKLGQVRGIAIAIAHQYDLKIMEYTPTTLKKNITGVGNASKASMQAAVKRQLSLNQTPPTDAADALALALYFLLDPAQQAFVNQAN